ncbi:transposase [Salmonella enterica]|nr:hypothetical protein [Salmonella enterica]EAY8676499.1 transposase [Salmonella enterica]EBB7876945.1 transposase [Salmonella enterica]
MAGITRPTFYEALVVLALTQKNDNAYVESVFRTVKYVPQWPSSGFSMLGSVREWVDVFTRGYNENHHRCGDDGEILMLRDALYQMGQSASPELWSGRSRNWQPTEAVTLNPDREKLAA